MSKPEEEKQNEQTNILKHNESKLKKKTNKQKSTRVIFGKIKITIIIRAIMTMMIRQVQSMLIHHHGHHHHESGGLVLFVQLDCLTITIITIIAAI